MSLSFEWNIYEWFLQLHDTDREIPPHAAIGIIPFQWDVVAESLCKDESKEPGSRSVSPRKQVTWRGITLEPFNHSGEECCHSGSKTLWSFWDRHAGARLLILTAQTSLSSPSAIDSAWVRTIVSATQLIVYRANIHKELVKKDLAHMVMVSNKQEDCYPL